MPPLICNQPWENLPWNHTPVWRHKRIICIAPIDVIMWNCHLIAYLTSTALQSTTLSSVHYINEVRTRQGGMVFETWPRQHVFLTWWMMNSSIWLARNQVVISAELGKITLAEPGVILKLCWITAGWFFPNHPRDHLITNTNLSHILIWLILQFKHRDFFLRRDF